MSVDAEELVQTPRWARGVWPIAVALFLLTAGVYGLSAGGHTYSSDEESLLLTVRGIVHHRSPVLLVSEDNAGLIAAVPGRVDGKPVSASGLATPLLSLPLYVTGVLVSKLAPAAYDDFVQRLFIGWTNSFVTALGVAFLFLACVELRASPRRAAFLAATYGFGTYAWAHAKTFFTEPSATTFALGATWLALRYRNAPTASAAAGAGAMLMLAVLGRQNAAIFIPPVCLYIAYCALRKGGVPMVVRAAVAVVIGATPVAAFLALTNWWRFGSALSLGYETVPLDFPVIEGLYGFFLSPGKAVWLYAPAALVGVASVLARRTDRAEVLLFAAMATTNAWFFAGFVHWHGDHSWGPRYLVLSLPFFILPLAGVIERPVWWRASQVAFGVGLVSALLGASIYFNQYFYVVEHSTPQAMEPDGPAYWDEMHFTWRWSPVIGHARLLDDAIANSIDRLDGDVAGHGSYPAEGTTRDRYGWYFAPPQLDSWVYWVLAAKAPRFLLISVVPFAVMIAGGARSLWRALALRSP